MSKSVSALALIAFVAFAAGTTTAVTQTAEAASMLLLGSGLAGFASAVRKRHRKSVKN